MTENTIWESTSHHTGTPCKIINQIIQAAWNHQTWIEANVICLAQIASQCAIGAKTLKEREVLALNTKWEMKEMCVTSGAALILLCLSCNVQEAPGFKTIPSAVSKIMLLKTKSAAADKMTEWQNTVKCGVYRLFQSSIPWPSLIIRTNKTSRLNVHSNVNYIHKMKSAVKVN